MKTCHGRWASSGLSQLVSFRYYLKLLPAPLIKLRYGRLCLGDASRPLGLWRACDSSQAKKPKRRDS